MSDPLRTDPSRALDAAAEADRDAKIEQLLLSGLDQYFAAQYEQAINIWTRALFIDRNHPRARAYIERARSALAERLRESEELLHSGVAAFQRGENDEARRLVQAALDRGAPLEEGLSVLERLNRIETGVSDRPRRASRSERPAAVEPPSEPASRPLLRSVLPLVALLAIILAGAWGIASSWLDWRRFDLGPCSSDSQGAGSRHAPAPNDVARRPRRGEIIAPGTRPGDERPARRALSC